MADQQQQAVPVPVPMLLASQPGIMRDGTRLAKPNYIDGLWTRFYQGMPRKMLGYQEQVRTFNGVCRTLQVFNSGGFCYVHGGSSQILGRYAIDLVSGVNTGLIDRSPAGYEPQANNLWSFGIVFDNDLPSGPNTAIYGVATPSLGDITSTIPAQVYFGDILANTPLQPVIDIGDGITPIMTSGGVVGIGPYLFTYGDGGRISWSVPGHPRNMSGIGSGTSFPVADKIIVGLPVRGTNAPSGIFWSLSSLIIGSFVGGTSFWSFTTITTNGSILSANSVVEHNGVYYWATTSGFSQFSGVMQDLPNEFNKDFFLSNLNLTQRQKVFAMKVPRWNEIWWCFPKGLATECDHAVIYNYVTKTWYDTPLPNGGRSAGFYNVTYSYPIMAGVALNKDTGGTSVWQHEIGLDEVSGAPIVPKAIQAYIETQEFSRLPQQPGQPGDPRATSYSSLEPDFNQVGPLTLEIYSRANARAPFESPTDDPAYPYVIPPNDASKFDTGYITDPTAQLVDFKWTGRLTSFLIESNSLGGNFVWGQPMIWAAPGDGRRTG